MWVCPFCGNQIDEDEGICQTADCPLVLVEYDEEQGTHLVHFFRDGEVELDGWVLCGYPEMSS